MELDDLKLETDGHSEGCPSMKFTKVDTTVDIICNSKVLLTTITIKEPLAPLLCSAYFSGGQV